MAHHDSNPFLELLKVWLLAKLIEHHSRALGFCQRQRKIDPVFFVWTLILGFSASSTRSISGLHRAYQRALGCDCDRSAFYKRFTPQLVSLLDALFQQLTCQTSQERRLGAFADILALDSTIIALWTRLAPQFCAYKQGQAAAKLQVVMSLKQATPNRVLIHQGTRSDHRAWTKVGTWVAGRLLLMDLGYYKHWLFHRIHQNQGFFLSRIKSSCALVILQDHSFGAGRRVDVVGCHLSQALKRLKRQQFEFIVQVPVMLRGGRRITYRWRAIGQRHPETGKYHVYLTNAPPELIPGEDARQLYALRWQIELLFKGLKSVGRLHQLPSSKREVVEALIKAAMLFVVLSGWLKQTLFEHQESLMLGLLRVQMVLRQWAPRLHHQLGQTRPNYQKQCELQTFRAQCRDPNGARIRAFAIAAIVEHS